MMPTDDTKDSTTESGASKHLGHLDNKDIRLLLVFAGFFVVFLIGVFYGMLGT